ncbi:MAG: ABC transporter permease, partial [Actinomycetota bacterium]
MSRTKRWFKKYGILLLGIAVIVYMYIPNMVVALMSFNDSSEARNLYAFQSFTLDNWLNICEPDGLCQSVVVSIEIAFLATLVATVLG